MRAARQNHPGWLKVTETSAMKRYISMKRSPKPAEILPGIYSFDPKYLHLMERVYAELSAEFPVTANEDGTAGQNGIPTGWETLLSVPGYGMDPLPIPLTDNGSLRETYGLDANPDFASNEDRALFHELVDEMFGHHTPASLHYRRGAVTGVPYMTADDDYKMSSLRRLLAAPDDLIRKVLTRPEDAAKEYGAVNAYAIFKRSQADGGTVKGRRLIPKERLSPDPAYVRSQGREGRLLPCDKSVVLDGRYYDMHSAMRERPVFGMNFELNHLGVGVASCVRAVYLDRFAFTFKHRSGEELAAKLSSTPHIVGCDVKNMDNTVWRRGIEELLIGLRRHWRDDFVDLLQAMLFAPFVIANPYRDGRAFDPFFGGDPFDPKSWTSWPGLPSGIFFNPDIGKFIMTFVYAIAARECGMPLKAGDGSLRRFLMGEAETKLCDMSDDALIGFPLKEMADKFDDYESPYMKLGVERPAAMLGNVAVRKDGVLAFVPNAVTYLSNFYVPEHGISSKLRRDFWSVGFVERNSHYAAAPAIARVKEIINKGMRDVFGVDADTLAAVHRLEHGLARDLSSIDQQVLTNPAYLHYRYSLTDLSAPTRELLAASIPAEESYPAIKRFFRNAN